MPAGRQGAKQKQAGPLGRLVQVRTLQQVKASLACALQDTHTSVQRLIFQSSEQCVQRGEASMRSIPCSQSPAGVPSGVVGQQV